SSDEPWANDPTEEVREVVLFSTNGKEHAFFVPQGDPVSFRDALSRADAEQWTEVALAELLAHLRNGTWTVVELPPGKVAIGSRWVFKLKINPDKPEPAELPDLGVDDTYFFPETDFIAPRAPAPAGPGAAPFRASQQCDLSAGPAARDSPPPGSSPESFPSPCSLLSAWTLHLITAGA
ncbi:hypothetical protein PENSPDRAFT_717919, partial [Peniophora sp. CONT]